MVCKEVYKSGVDDAAEQLPQITAHTDASVLVWVWFVSTLEYGRYESSVPGFREMTNTQNQVEQFNYGQLEFMIRIFQHLI